MARVVRPNAKLIALSDALTKKKRPKDNYVADLYDQITSGTVSTEVECALDVINTSYYKDKVVAFLISGATCDHIARVLEMPQKTVEYVEKLVFDRSTFWHKLELFRYAERYAETECAEENRALITNALHGGPMVLEGYFRHGYETLKIDPATYAQSALAVANYNIIRSQGRKITSDVTKESLNWIRTANQTLSAAMDVLKTTDISEVVIAIKNVQQKRTIEDLDLKAPDDLLH